MLETIVLLCVGASVEIMSRTTDSLKEGDYTENILIPKYYYFGGNVTLRKLR
jgi:hypothetical protein